MRVPGQFRRVVNLDRLSHGRNGHVTDSDTLMDPLCFDHAATTPIRPEVRAVGERLRGAELGNPSSHHRWGRRAAAVLDEARARVATALGCRASEVLFVRGGTESDNLAVRGSWAALTTRHSSAGVIHSAVEHAAVRETAEALEAAGASRHVIPVDACGRPDLDELDRALDEGPAVVSMMWVNNEIGTVMPVADAARLCAARDGVFHTDAVQAIGHVEIRLDESPIALLSATGHKIGGPRGTGILFVRAGTPLAPTLTGGGQERGIRPGTQDVVGAAEMAEALALAVTERKEESRRLTAMRMRLEHLLVKRLPDLRVHARDGDRAPHILNIGVPGADPALLIQALDLAGLAASSGSACSSGAHRAGPVLSALLGDAAEGVAPVRLSLGRTTSTEQIDQAAAIAVPVLERMMERSTIGVPGS